MKEPIHSEAQVNEIIGRYPKVFQGIGCHKYTQIKLKIDPTVTLRYKHKEKYNLPKESHWKKF